MDLGWLLGHNFVARYDYQPSVGKIPDLKNREEVEFFVEELVSRFYVYDVCHRCGIISERRHDTKSSQNKLIG